MTLVSVPVERVVDALRLMPDEATISQDELGELIERLAAAPDFRPCRFQGVQVLEQKGDDWEVVTRRCPVRPCTNPAVEFHDYCHNHLDEVREADAELEAVAAGLGFPGSW